MAQSANSKTPLNIEVFWEKPSHEPPLEWKKWINVFEAAVFAKEDIPCSTLRGVKPSTVDLPKRPKFETPVGEETQNEKREREVRNSISQTRWENDCEKARQKGLMCGDTHTWAKADRKSVGLMFLSLGTEGRKIFLRKNGSVDISSCSYKDMHKACSDSFEKPRNLTFDRYLFFTRTQKKEENLEQFLCALRELAQHCQFGVLESTLIRDIFTAHILDFEIQKELLQETKTPSEAFDLAIRMELSLANTRHLNKAPPAGGGLHNSSGTVNAIQRQNQGSRGQFRNRVPGQRSDKCYRCGSPNCDR